MKLFCDINEQVQVLVEEVAPGQKNYFIEGVFLQCDTKNRNNRIYEHGMMTEKIKEYNDTFIKQKRAFGELGHPEGPTINLERVSHMITDLYSEKKNFIGRAKIMDTPYGKIVKNLIDEGAKLGVSSRGIGSLEEKNGVNYVKKDYQIATAADIVADPSAPEAFVRGIMEGKEWVLADGRLREQDAEEIKKQVKQASSKNLDEVKIQAFARFLRNI